MKSAVSSPPRPPSSEAIPLAEGAPSGQQHRTDGQSAVIKLAEVEASPRDRLELVPCEEIELTEHRRSSHVDRAAEWRAIRLVRMPGQDRDDPSRWRDTIDSRAPAPRTMNIG
jgi:hypothetical protein